MPNPGPEHLGTGRSYLGQRSQVLQVTPKCCFCSVPNRKLKEMENLLPLSSCLKGLHLITIQRVKYSVPPWVAGVKDHVSHCYRGRGEKADNWSDMDLAVLSRQMTSVCRDLWVLLLLSAEPSNVGLLLACQPTQNQTKAKAQQQLKAHNSYS